MNFEQLKEIKEVFFNDEKCYSHDEARKKYNLLSNSILSSDMIKHYEEPDILYQIDDTINTNLPNVFDKNRNNGVPNGVPNGINNEVPNGVYNEVPNGVNEEINLDDDNEDIFNMSKFKNEIHNEIPNGIPNENNIQDTKLNFGKSNFSIIPTGIEDDDDNESEISEESDENGILDENPYKKPETEFNTYITSEKIANESEADFHEKKRLMRIRDKYKNFGTLGVPNFTMEDSLSNIKTMMEDFMLGVNRNDAIISYSFLFSLLCSGIEKISGMFDVDLEGFGKYMQKTSHEYEIYFDKMIDQGMLKEPPIIIKLLGKFAWDVVMFIDKSNEKHFIKDLQKSYDKKSSNLDDILGH